MGGILQLLRGGSLSRLKLRAAITGGGGGEETPSGGLDTTTNGLLYATDFATLDGWTGDAQWTVSTTPRLVSFGRFPRALLTPGPSGAGGDVDGVRESQLYVEGSTWWLIYDAGDHIGGWRQFIASSTDRGLTWTRHGVLGPTAGNGLGNGAGGNYAAVATGWFEKRGSTYYLHRVTAMGNFTAPNIGLPLGPYGWDTWSASSPLGPWTFVNKTDPVPGSWGSIDFLPGAVIQYAGTWYAFAQGFSGDAYQVGVATGPSATGPWTPVGAAFWTTEHFGGRDPENPKAFYHPGLGRWALLVNMIGTAGTHTDRNAVALSSNISSGWTGSTITYTQSTDPDTSDNAVGLAAHVTGPNGALVHDPDTGNVPIVFDAAPREASPGWHLGRSILTTILEPSPSAAACDDPTGTNRTITRPLAHSNFTAEMIVRLSSGTNTNVGFWFRQDGAGNGYRLVVRSLDQLLLQKVVGGVVSTVFNVESGLNAPNADFELIRLRVQANGSSIKAWINGEQQIDVTDTAFASGTHVGLSSYAADCSVRRLSIRTGNDITVTGLTPGETVVLRSHGGLPVTTAVADGSGVAAVAVTHGPHAAIEVDGIDYLAADDLWPGGVYEVQPV